MGHPPPCEATPLFSILHLSYGRSHLLIVAPYSTAMLSQTLVPPPPACHGLILPLACVLLCFYFTAEDAPEDAQTFWRTVDQAVLEPAEGGGHFLDLKTCNWLGMAKSLNHIMYVRECYPELWNYIKNNPEKHRFGILGKPMFFF